MLTETHTLPEAMSAWVRGWAFSRGVPAPVATPGGFRIDVGIQGQRVRHVLHTYDSEALLRLSLEHTDPGTWIKVGGDAREFRATLPPRWVSADAGHLMTTTLAADDLAPPAPYTLSVDVEGPVVVARVTAADGDVAASGRLAMADAYGIVDQVVTEEAHRRRGLGRLVMRAMADRAVKFGVETGVLVATDEGRALYETLGWVWRSDVPGAYLPEEG